MYGGERNRNNVKKLEIVFSLLERIKTVKSNKGVSILAIIDPWKKREDELIAIVAKEIKAISLSCILLSLRIPDKKVRVRKEARVTKGRYLL